MKKGLLLVVTFLFTLTLTGCSTESRIENLLEDYEDFFNDVVNEEATDIEDKCITIFAELDAIDCIDEITNFNRDEFPYAFVVDLELVSYTEYEGEFRDYDKVYLVTFNLHTSSKESLLSEVKETTISDTILVVKEDGKLKLATEY